ncbi:MAG: sulfur carrier protein ThiS [Marinilabiliales bacterium]|nr:MAG: sulfur carrier protein ThiS [Marinilabiliales bacterium]
MHITLNNRKEEFDRSTMTVRELLDEKNFTFKMLVIKINGQLVRKEDYEKAVISDGDDVSVIHLISGG